LHTNLIKREYTKVKKPTVERRSTGMSNYTEEMTNMLVGAYLDKPTPETVEALAEHLGRSKKSIIGKVSREGVYRREVYVTKTGESPITKVEIVNNIAESLGVETTDLTGLEKSPKAALRTLEKAVAGLEQINNYPGGV
jgi:hypothetical protein